MKKEYFTVLLVLSLGCLGFTVQNDGHADTPRFHIHLLNTGKFLCVHLKSQFPSIWGHHNWFAANHTTYISVM